VNTTTQISLKDVRKIVRAGRLIEQILSTLPPELRTLGFDAEIGRRAVDERWAKHKARKAAGRNAAEAA
jgi:hypothetical protein